MLGLCPLLEPVHPRGEDMPGERLDIAFDDEQPIGRRLGEVGFDVRDHTITDRPHPVGAHPGLERGEDRPPHLGLGREVLVEGVEKRPRGVDRSRVGLRIEFDLELVETRTHEGDEHAVTIAELVVERRDGDTRAFSQFAHREPVDPGFGDQRTGRVEHVASRSLLSSLPAVTHRRASIGCRFVGSFT